MGFFLTSLKHGWQAGKLAFGFDKENDGKSVLYF